uniref:Uncharacterized protein n=1 Tax=viral metagenome TaxID=1070528 RepID=A0A6M3JGM8_9ZZZZ
MKAVRTKEKIEIDCDLSACGIEEALKEMPEHNGRQTWFVLKYSPESVRCFAVNEFTNLVAEVRIAMKAAFSVVFTSNMSLDEWTLQRNTFIGGTLHIDEIYSLGASINETKTDGNTRCCHTGL